MQQSFSGEMALGAELGRIFGNVFNNDPKAKADKEFAQRGINKVLALAGLTLTGSAAIPQSLAWESSPLTRKAVLSIGVGSLGLHVLYSVWDFYGLSLSKLWAAKAKGKTYEKTAIVAG